MGIYFIFQIIIQYYFLLLLKQFQFGHYEFFLWLLYPFDITNHFEGFVVFVFTAVCCYYCCHLSHFSFEHFSTFLYCKITLRPILYVSWLIPESSISLRPCFLSLEAVLETKICIEVCLLLQKCHC